MKIFVVNLKKSKDRRKAMESQLKKLNLNYEIFEAVDGYNLPISEFEKYYDEHFFKNRRPYYSLGIAGCTLSHYQLYRKIVDQKIENALILEDDMVINKDILSVLPFVEQQLKDDEVIMLFYQSRSSINISQPFKIPSSINKYALYKVDSLKGLGSTGGYCINYNTAKKMAESLLPLSTGPDDWEIFFERGLLQNIKVIYPFILENSYASTTINSFFKGKQYQKSILNFIENNRIFPFYHILRNRRKKFYSTRQNVQINN